MPLPTRGRYRTGSATAATIALLASLLGGADSDIHWRIEQGVDMGRPSLLQGRTERRQGRISAVHIGGRVVTVMRGEIQLPDALTTAPLTKWRQASEIEDNRQAVPQAAQIPERWQSG